MNRKMFIFLLAFLAVLSSFIGHGKILAAEAPVITSPINNGTYPMDDVVCELTWTPVPGATKYCYALWDVTDGNEVLLTKYDGRTARYGSCTINDGDVQENHRYKLVLKAYVNGEFISSDPVYFSVGVRNFDCQVIDYSIPSTMEAGSSYPVSITFQNTGSESWSDLNQNYMKITDDYSHFGLSNRMNLVPGEIITPGASKTFQFTMTPDATGEYLVKFWMANGTTRFGSGKSQSITVTPSNRLSYDAKLSGDSLPSEIIVGQSTNLRITATNTGQTEWSGNGIYLQCKIYGKNNYYVLDKKYLDGQVIKPGESKTFVFTVKFDEKQTVGCEAQMANNGTIFGEKLSKSFKVVTVDPTRITLDVNGVNMTIGDPPLQLHATIYPSNATNQQIEWYSSNSSVATVNDKGLVTPKAVGHTSIHAMSLANPDVYDTCRVDVVPKVSVTEVKLNATSIEKKPDDIPFQLFATVYPAEANNKRVSWSSSNSRVATVNDLGMVTIVGVGTSTITASSVADPSKKATCTLVVAGTYKSVTSVSLNKKSLILKTNGGTETLVATVFPIDASDKQINWISTNPQVATVNSSGVVTPISVGNTTIVARSKANEQKQDTCEVTVLKTNDSKPTVVTGSASVNGTSVTLNASVNSATSLRSFGFNWGSSSNTLNNTVYGQGLSGATSGNFKGELSRLNPGVYYYKAFAENSAGMAYDNGVKSFEIHGTVNQGPKVKINKPQDGAVHKVGEKVLIEATAVDDVKVVAMGLYINNETIARLRVDRGTISYQWDTSVLKPGWYPVKITAWDGEKTDQKTIQVRIEDASKLPNTEIPVINYLTVYPERGYAGQEYTFTAKVKNSPKYVYIQFDDARGGWLDKVMCSKNYRFSKQSSNADGTETYVFKTKVSSPGVSPNNLRSYKVYAVSDAGESQPYTGTFVVYPKLQVVSPVINPKGGQYKSPQSITISCATAGATIRYTLDGTEPTNTSPVYNGPIAVNNSLVIKAVAQEDGMNNSQVVSESYTIAFPKRLPGILGSYYNYFGNDTSDEELVLQRIDRNINEDWGDKTAPASYLSHFKYKIYWNGYITAPETGSYYFKVVADDGVQMKVGNYIGIDQWKDGEKTGEKAPSFKIHLIKGQEYPFYVYYYQNMGKAQVKLAWKLPSQSTYQIVPPEVFSYDPSQREPNVPFRGYGEGNDPEIKALDDSFWLGLRSLSGVHYDPVMAYWSAMVANDQYSKSGKVRSKTLETLGFDSFYSFDKPFDNPLVHGIWAKRSTGNIVAISFQGTYDGNGWTDYFTDASVYPELWNVLLGKRLTSEEDEFNRKLLSGNHSAAKHITGEYSKKYKLVHSGFGYAMVNAMRDIPLDKNAIYWISGHSLGGAEAELCALYLCDKGIPSNHIICYGIASPPVGSLALFNYANELGVSSRIFKVLNDADPVPGMGAPWTYTLSNNIYTYEQKIWGLHADFTWHFPETGYLPRMKLDAWRAQKQKSGGGGGW